jgi:glycosyltransferase involved in cell wall biosynthesis
MASDSTMGARSGIVVIGRNEGERLLACLDSVRSLGCPVVYIDSGSTDGSLERAAALCDLALALDPARPSSAARARNEGLRALIAARPSCDWSSSSTATARSCPAGSKPPKRP